MIKVRGDQLIINNEEHPIDRFEENMDHLTMMEWGVNEPADYRSIFCDLEDRKR